MISRLINPHFGIAGAFRWMIVPLLVITIALAVKGGAMKDHRGGEKLYHLAPLFSINVRANC